MGKLFMRRALFTSLSFTLVLAACSSSPTARFYMLDSIPPTEQSASGAKIVGVGPVDFPEYLNRPQIVTRGAGGELKLAEFDRWAEPLEENFERTLAANLDSLLQDTLVMKFPFGGGRVQPDFRILLQVARFDVDSAGSANLDVRWGIMDASGDDVIPPRRSVYRAQSAAPADYSAAVEALNQTLRSFSREIVEALNAHSAG